ncbi:hypothetical protein Tco_0567876 [Tanacetum coccineum]
MGRREMQKEKLGVPTTIVDTTKAQQIALDDALVAPANRLKIGKCNQRISSTLKSNEATIQVVLDALKLTPFCKAFEVTANVSEMYMQEFWATVSLHHKSLCFKMNDKSHTVNLENFRDMLQICPRLPGQKFEDPPFEEEILSFIRDLGHTGEIKNVDYVYLLWEDLVNQVENKNSKKNIDMCYPLFTKVIIDYFMSKDQSISRRNKMFWHTARDDPMFNTIRVISKHLDTQIYGSILPEPPKAKTKYKKKADGSDTSSKPKSSLMVKGKRLKTSGKTQFHSSHASGSSDGADTQLEVPDEQQQKDGGTDEGAGDDDDDDNDEHDLNNEKDGIDDDEKNDNEETKSDDNVSTPPDREFTEEKENQEGNDYVKEGEQEDEEEELYGDLNLNLERRDVEMIDAQTNQDTEDVHATLTAEPPVSHNLVNVPVSIAAVTPSSITIIPKPPVLIIQTLQQTPDSTTTTPNPITTLPEIPNFASLFGFEQRVSALETKMSEFKQTSQFAEVVSLIPAIVDNYLASKMKDAVDVAIQLQLNNLREEAQAKNEEFINKDIFSSCGDVVTLKRGRDDQDKDKDPSAGLNRGSKRRRSGKEAESSKEPTNKESKSTSSSKIASGSQPKSSGKSAQVDKHGQKVDDLEKQSYQEFNTRNDDATPIREVQNVNKRQWNPSSSPTPDRKLHTTTTIDDRPPQTWITQLAQASGKQSFNEFLATSIDFSAFIMNQLKINNLTQDVLTGPTYDLLKGTCKSVVELKCHLEENAQGRECIPFSHFINNDLEYLKGRSLSQRYTTSITKMKAVDYGHVKWIEDKGLKSQKFYGYTANMETSKDVYSRHRIITVTSLKIRQFFGYRHLEEIIVRRQDDQLYKFREGDLKRLRRQDIEDMLLLLVQGKLTNLNLDERYVLNVALRMYTRRIVIQERVEDLQLGVESYQKKIDLSRPDTYHSNLIKITPCIAYPDIQGIIYQDDMDRNRLMRTKELHKFSDGTLNYVRTALNDIATIIQMDYCQRESGSKQDKQRDRVSEPCLTINSEDRRLMRSLEKFVGGRPYEGDPSAAGKYHMIYHMMSSS